MNLTQIEIKECLAVAKRIETAQKTGVGTLANLTAEDAVVIVNGLRALGDGKDAERLDYLERESNSDPLLLHNLPLGSNFNGFRGLGLKCTNRTLRQAIDDMCAGYKNPAAMREEPRK